ncbi:MAG: rhodanese-like domain-containing protein [Desulfobacteraceae bacterium]|jgi:rhodanese-related sulfurtransferase
MDAASLVAKRGYSNIMIFKDGIPGWIDAGYAVNKSAPKDTYKAQWIDPAELNATLDQYLVVDIRPVSAYKKGYLPESRAMPMAYLSMLSVELPKDRRIVLIDNGGHQLIKAAQWMTDNGFEDITILKGGMTAYIESGFELKK